MWSDLLVKSIIIFPLFQLTVYLWSRAPFNAADKQKDSSEILFHIALPHECVILLCPKLDLIWITAILMFIYLYICVCVCKSHTDLIQRKRLDWKQVKKKLIYVFYFVSL